MIDHARLEALRAELDGVDGRMLELMAARQRLVEAVAAVKGRHTPLRDRTREQAILARIRAAAVEAGLSPKIAVPVWRRLLEVSVEHERRVLERSEDAAACCGCRDPLG